ncbi:MAG: FAD:protein FMN transferase [Lentisphaeria bacterium]|nr:FAD:protein FMN transferase [Lentisphaeria bacterium]
MKKYVKIVLAAVIVSSCLAAVLILDRKSERFSQTRTFPMMGTMGRITIYSDREDLPEKALNQVQKTIGEIEKACNIFHPESELSRLNRTAYEKEFACSPLLWEMLAAADHYCRFTGGAYDPTIAPLMKLWGFRRKRQTLPSAPEIAEAMKQVGWNRVKLDPEKHSIRFLSKGIGIDFGGIAKGFALEKAMEILRRNGVRRAILDFGGNIGCIMPEKHEPFRIGIRDPESPAELLDTIEMRNCCIATSGNYERYVIIQGKQYAHIMDPRTGLPVSGVLSVTVVTPHGTDSDALSTAIFVRGEKFAEEVCRKLPDTGVLMVRSAPDTSSGRSIRRFGSLVK